MKKSQWHHIFENGCNNNYLYVISARPTVTWHHGTLAPLVVAPNTIKKKNRTNQGVTPFLPPKGKRNFPASVAMQ